MTSRNAPVRPSDPPDRAAVLREVVAAAEELIDRDDAIAFARLAEAVKAWRRLPKEQLGLEVGR